MKRYVIGSVCLAVGVLGTAAVLDVRGSDINWVASVVVVALVVAVGLLFYYLTEVRGGEPTATHGS